MKIMTERPRDYDNGIPPVQSFADFRQLGFYGDLGIPKQWACQFCGRSLVREECWTSATAFDNSNGTTGYAMIFHCRDCDPYKDIDNMRHRGEARMMPPAEHWKVVQGDV